jgi:positive regulator of sigma E activity
LRLIFWGYPMSKSGSFDSIEHDGIVQRSDNKSVTIRILSVSGCSGCHAEGSCTISGTGEKMVQIPGFFNLAPGDHVTVIMNKSSGYAAVMYGYVFPLILVIVVLVILASLHLSELYAGLGSLSVLIPYYSVLWIFKKRINKKFIFNIKT